MGSFLIIAFTSSFCSMSFSMVMALLMSEFTGEEVLTQCLTLGPYLLGLGIGSFYGDRIPEALRLRRIFELEWLSVLLLPLVPVAQLLGVFLFLNLAPTNMNFESPGALSVLLGLTSVLALFSGLLGGAQLPLIIRSAVNVRSEVILAVNYLGPLLAGITVVFLSGKALGFGIQIYIIGLVQILGLYALLQKLEKRIKAIASLLLPLGVLFSAGAIYPELETLTVKSSYMKTRIGRMSELLDPRPLLRVLRQYGVLERVRTSYQTIDLFIEPGDPNFGVPENATLYLNRKPQFDLFSVEVYHQTMIDGAVNLLGKTPERILILGAGDGLLLHELRKLPEVNEIVMVELDDKVIAWASENPIARKLNHDVLLDPPANARILIEDGVSYLRRNTNRFDLILVDFPFPNGQELAKLYSREFYELVRRSLTPEGLTVIDLPLYLDEGKALSQESRTILKTLEAAGLTNRLLIGPNASFVAARPGGEKLRFRYENFPKDLALSSSFNLVAPFAVEEFGPKDQVNTMFWPRGL